MNESDQINMMSVDVSNLLNTLICYKLAAKSLTKEEIRAVLETGSKEIAAQLSKRLSLPRQNIEKMVLDVAANIENTISGMALNDGGI